MSSINPDKYANEELIIFINSNPNFSSSEKVELRKSLKEDNYSNTNLKILLTALKDGVVKLPHLPEARKWYLESPIDLVKILEERYESEANFIKPNIYSDKLFKNDQELESVINSFIEMYKGSDNEKIMPTLYKLMTIPRNLFVPLLNMLLLRLCTIEDILSIETLSEDNVKKFARKILSYNYLLNDQLYQYTRKAKVHNVKYNDTFSFFDMAYFMMSRFNAKKTTPVETLRITFVKNAAEAMSFKNCYSDEEFFSQKYLEVLNDEEAGILRKLNIFLNDETDSVTSSIFKNLFDNYLKPDSEIFADNTDLHSIYDYTYDNGEITYKKNRYSEYFDKLDKILFKPLCEGITLNTSYKLLINTPDQMSRAKIYRNYIQCLADFYFPYENSLRILNSITESVVKDPLYLNLVKENYNDINETSADLLYKVDAKLNKILLTKRFLICTDYDEEKLKDFDSCVTILMTKIKFFMKLLMAIYSISSISLKTLKG